MERQKARKEKMTTLVTGATRGIGREAARQLAARGARVILAVRDAKKGQEVVDEILRECPDADVILGPTLDLASCQSIRSFAKAYGPYPLHVLLNNAALGSNALKSLTPEGIVNLVQVNFLGPFLLTRLLEEKLKESAPSRVVNVSSISQYQKKKLIKKKKPFGGIYPFGETSITDLRVITWQ